MANISTLSAKISFLNDAQIEGVQVAAKELNIGLDSFDWYIQGFQSAIKGTEKTIITLGELLELQSIRIEEGQTVINDKKVASFFIKNANNLPWIAASKNKKGWTVDSNPLFVDIVVAQAGDFKTLLSGGHRAEGIATLVKILADDDPEVTQLYLQETNVEVVLKEFPSRQLLAKAMLAENGSRNPVKVEKEQVKIIASLGINPNNVSELREAVESNRVRIQDWFFKFVDEALESRLLNPATGEPLKDLTRKELFASVYTRLSTEAFDIMVADDNGNETTVPAASYRFIRDLMLSNKHDYKLTDEQFALWSEYGDTWQFDDKTKKYNWVIPSFLSDVIRHVATATQTVFSETTVTNIAYEATKLAEYIANETIDLVMADETLSAYALPPKPAKASVSKRNVNRTKK